MGAKPVPFTCQSYYDDDNVLRDCTCGKCEKQEKKPVYYDELSTGLKGWMTYVDIRLRDLSERVSKLEAK